jgi:hypothetical protein
VRRRSATATDTTADVDTAADVPLFDFGGFFFVVTAVDEVRLFDLCLLFVEGAPSAINVFFLHSSSRRFHILFLFVTY